MMLSLLSLVVLEVFSLNMLKVMEQSLNNLICIYSEKKNLEMGSITALPSIITSLEVVNFYGSNHITSVRKIDLYRCPT